MFDIGFSEMVLLGVIALIAIGPKQLPEVARKLARFINDVKRVTNEFTGQMLDARESANRLLSETRDDIFRSLNDDGSKPESTEEIAPPQPSPEAVPYNTAEPVHPPPFEGPLPEPDPGASLPPHDPYYPSADGVPEQMSLALESQPSQVAEPGEDAHAASGGKPVKGSDER